MFTFLRQRRHRRTIVARMKVLSREILKYQYLDLVLCNPPYTLDRFDAKRNELRQLETDYPALKLIYSPSRAIVFCEWLAVEAYGAKQWGILRRTYDLLDLGSFE